METGSVRKAKAHLVSTGFTDLMPIFLRIVDATCRRCGISLVHAAPMPRSHIKENAPIYAQNVCFVRQVGSFQGNVKIDADLTGK